MAVPEQIGRYRVGRVLGTGGASTVVLAHDPELDVEVAVKVLADNLARRPEVVAAFLREARLLREVVDRGVVSVHDIGVLASGQPYFVMDREWGTLADVLRARDAARRPLRPAEVRAVAVGLAAALEAVHRRGVVHGDVKPENLFVRPAGPAPEDAGALDLVAAGYALGDFGVAGAPGEAPVGGTPGYLAPEVAEGAGSDARADLYAATAVLHRLRVGRPPGPADDPAPQAAGRGQAELWAQGLATDPGVRPASAVAWLALVEAELDEGWGRGGGRRPGGRGAVALAVVGTVIAAVVAVALAVVVVGGPGADPGPARAVAAGPGGRDVVVLHADGRLRARRGHPALPSARVEGATALAVTGEGVVVVRAEAGEVRRLGPGEDELVVGSEAVGRPVAVAVDDATGRLVVLDAAGPWLLEVRGDVVTRLAGRVDGLRTPAGLALGADGAIYVADGGAHCVHVYRAVLDRCGAAGQDGVVGDAGDGGAATAAQLRDPAAVALGPDGSLLVADAGAYRVRRVVEGRIEALAGSGDAAAVGGIGRGGPATAADLVAPSSLAGSDDGRTWIVDDGVLLVVGADGVIAEA